MELDCSTPYKARVWGINAFNLDGSKPVLGLKMDGPFVDNMAKQGEWEVGCSKRSGQPLGGEQAYPTFLRAYRDDLKK